MISTDGLSREELRALSAWDQACALNDLYDEIKRLTDKKVDANSRYRAAQMVALDKPSTETKVAVLAAKAVLERVTIEIAGRKEQIKCLQTLIRAVPS